MRFWRVKSQLVQVTLAIFLLSVASGLTMYKGAAQLTSNYFYRLAVNREGFTTVEVIFNSTDTSGNSWVFVPKYQDWTHIETSGRIVSSEVVGTTQVTNQDLYFYQAFKFTYQSENNLFRMTIRFDFDNGALILEPRGIFYSPFIGFEASSNGNAEVLFDSSFDVNPDLAIVVGSSNYPAQKVELHRVLFRLEENIVRLQVEFSMDAEAVITPLRNDDNKTFTFNTVSRYKSYAINVLRFYDSVYNQTARLFNVTLEDVVVQWFLPDFDSLLAVGGFVPVFTGGLGEININIVFIRTVNGTVEDIAMHELVHRFLGKAGIPPSEFLWFHEGMAQYISVTTVSNMGYEGGQTEKTNLESSAQNLIQLLGGEDFGEISLQQWSPSFEPPTADVNSLYAASYYVTSRLPQIVRRDGFEYYEDFFELIGKLPTGLNGEKVTNISELALYLSQAANASVASTLKRWGFTVADLYESPVQDLIVEAGKAVSQVNPIFQPYRFLAEYLYRQALLSAEAGDWTRTESLLQLSITMANLAPLLTFLTVAAILALLSYALYRLSRRPRQVVAPPLPEIMGSSA